MAVRVGVQIDGLPEAKKLIGDIQTKAGTWARTRVGVEVRVPYAHWIEHGRYFSGRPGSTHAYRYAERAKQDVLGSLGPKVAKSLLPGGDPSKTATEIATTLQARMRSYQPSVSGRLRQSTVVFRGGGIRNL
jgi:hypothetical protein